MSDVLKEREQVKEMTLVESSCDEALEAAAGAGSGQAGKYTLFYCTALDLCPGPCDCGFPIATGKWTRGHSFRSIVPVPGHVRSCYMTWVEGGRFCCNSPGVRQENGRPAG